MLNYSLHEVAEDWYPGCSTAFVTASFITRFLCAFVNYTKSCNKLSNLIGHLYESGNGMSLHQECILKLPDASHIVGMARVETSITETVI